MVLQDLVNQAIQWLILNNSIQFSKTANWVASTYDRTTLADNGSW